MNKEEYQERQNAKLERFNDLAKKNKRASESAFNQSHELGEAIPFGQPILIGHHSERRHRRDIDRIQNLMNKGIEAGEKAEYYEGKADNILNPSSISSDDPEAIEKLKEKMAGLEAKRQKLKEFNKKARKENKELLPSYVLSNLSQNIGQIKKRIEHLESLNRVEEKEETINGITIKVDKNDNRVKIFFPSIPGEEVRTKLKRNGFHWSPYNRCWQRMISNWAVTVAQDIAKEVKT